MKGEREGAVSKNSANVFYPNKVSKSSPTLAISKEIKKRNIRVSVRTKCPHQQSFFVKPRKELESEYFDTTPSN